MTTKEIKITYQEFMSLDELQPEDKMLAEAAIEAIGHSYAPYSKFNVGAAVLLEDGTIVKGSNQENAAYPSGLCAERTAMFYANHEYPDLAMKSIAIAAGQQGILCEHAASPCGACRQVMAQYETKSGKPMNVLLVGSKSIQKFEKIDDLLPLIFDNI